MTGRSSMSDVRKHFPAESGLNVSRNWSRNVFIDCGEGPGETQNVWGTLLDTFDLPSVDQVCADG